MKENKGVWASLAALLPALVLAATGWMEAKAAQTKKYEALESYREYIEDRMARDEALEKALSNCMALLPALAAHEEAGEAEEQPMPEVEINMEAAPGEAGTWAVGSYEAVDLDEVAEEFGYEQKQAPK